MVTVIKKIMLDRAESESIKQRRVILTPPTSRVNFDIGSLPLPGIPWPERWNSKASLREQLTKIKSEFAEPVYRIADLCQIPQAVLFAWIAIESGGKPQPMGSNGIVGPMQIQSSYYLTQIKDFIRDFGPVLDDHPYIINSLTEGGVISIDGDRRISINKNFNLKRLTEPDLNIIHGGYLISRLTDMKWAFVDDRYALERIVVAYNAGLYSKSFKKVSDPTQAMATPTGAYLALRNSNSESARFIAKLYANGAILDTLTQVESNEYEER